MSAKRWGGPSGSPVAPTAPPPPRCTPLRPKAEREGAPQCFAQPIHGLYALCRRRPFPGFGRRTAATPLSRTTRRCARRPFGVERKHPALDRCFVGLGHFRLQSTNNKPLRARERHSSEARVSCVVPGEEEKRKEKNPCSLAEPLGNKVSLFCSFNVLVVPARPGLPLPPLLLHKPLQLVDV